MSAAKRMSMRNNFRDEKMNRNIAGFKSPAATLMTLLWFAVALLASPIALAAVHSFALTAETLPNGQLAYKLNNEKAVIPGPTLFVKEGDTVNINLTNNTGVAVGFIRLALGPTRPQPVSTSTPIIPIKKVYVIQPGCRRVLCVIPRPVVLITTSVQLQRDLSRP